MLERKNALMRHAKPSGFVRMFIPPATTISVSPLQREVQDIWIAVKLDEQAVSQLKLDPQNPKSN